MTESFRDLDLPLTEADSAEEALVLEIQALGDQLAPFTDPAWDRVARVIEATYRTELHQLGHAPYTTEQIWQARGRVQALAWILERKDVLSDQLATLRTQLDEVSEREGSDVRA